jgi:hypothetical protein
MRFLFLASLASYAACSSDDADPAHDAGTDAAACSTEATCELCLLCAASGPCADLSIACQEDADCRDFYLCIGEADDPVVIEQCRTDHAAGAGRYCADTECTVYGLCDALCEPSAVCAAPSGGS